MKKKCRISTSAFFFPFQTFYESRPSRPAFLLMRGCIKSMLTQVTGLFSASNPRTFSVRMTSAGFFYLCRSNLFHSERPGCPVERKVYGGQMLRRSSKDKQ
jgi:hypothetical protein